MDDIDPITMYELCFPGSVTGSTEIACPHCETLLTLKVDDPTGIYEVRCCDCSGTFEINLLENTMTWNKV